MTQNSHKNSLIIGIFSAWSTFALLLMYIPVTILGIMSLKSPSDPISNPYFTIMELLILLIAPLLVICIAVIYVNSKPKDKIHGIISLIFMTILAIITSSVHFVILTVSRQIESLGFTSSQLFFSFSWPSVVYTLDILAWDWFFALSMIFGALTFNRTKFEKKIRAVMIVSGILSLIGLIGVPLANMNVRNIGIIGYTIVAAIAFFMIRIAFKKQINNNNIKS